MNRRELTANISALIQQMIAEGEQPILDYVLRSTEEQQRLFKAGLSSCDGITKKSRHQSVRAADIYLWNFVTKKVDWQWDPAKAEYWHTVWVEKYGGDPMVVLKNGKVDYPHFQ